jgi:hypothetical protein
MHTFVVLLNQIMSIELTHFPYNFNSNVLYKNYIFFNYSLGTRQSSHTMLRSSLKSAASPSYTSRYRTSDITSQQRQQPFSTGTLTRRHRPSLDYSSDTEATCASSPRSSYYYYRCGDFIEVTFYGDGIH